MPELRTRISLDSSQFQAGLRAARSSANELASALGAGLSFGAIVAGLKSTIAYAHDLELSAERVGMSVTGWQSISAAALMAGVGTDKLATSVNKLQANLSNDKPTDAMVTAVARMGLRFADLKAMAPEEQLTAVLHGLAGISDQGERAATAIALMGRGGTALIPLAKEFDTLTKSAKDFGLVISDETLAKVARLNTLLEVLSLRSKAGASDFLAAVNDMGAAASDSGFWTNVARGAGNLLAKAVYLGVGSRTPFTIDPGKPPETSALSPNEVSRGKVTKAQSAQDAWEQARRIKEALAEKQRAEDLEKVSKKLVAIQTNIEGDDAAAKLFEQTYGLAAEKVADVAREIGNGDVDAGIERMMKRMQLFVKAGEASLKTWDSLIDLTGKADDAQAAYNKTLQDQANERALENMARAAEMARDAVAAADKAFAKAGGQPAADAAGHLGETGQDRANRKRKIKEDAIFEDKLKKDAAGEYVHWTKKEKQRLGEAALAENDALNARRDAGLAGANLDALGNVFRDAARGAEIVTAVNKLTDAVNNLNIGLGPN